MEEVVLEEALRRAILSAQLSFPWHPRAQPTCLPVTGPAITGIWALPFTHRMTADGILHSVGRLGAMMGPLILMSRQALPLLPPLLYGVISIASSLVVLFFLPETQGLPLPDTIQDLESQ